MKKKITIRIITSNGHNSFHLELCDVNEFLIKQSKKLGLWLYIDGVHSDPYRIDKNALASSKEIILTQALVGG